MAPKSYKQRRDEMDIKTAKKAKKLILKKAPAKKKTKTKLASFGGITFVVSRKKILTLSDIKRSESVRWQVHDTIGRKPMAEYIGPGQESITFHVVFKTALGVNPFKTIQKLRHFQHEGKVGPFMIGKKTIANSKFYLEDLQETYRHIDNKGVIHTIEADLTIKEYNTVRVKKKKKSSSKNTKSNKGKTSNKKVTGTITISAGMLNARVSPSLNARIKKVLRKGQKYNVYGIEKGSGITWYNLGSSLWCSAGSNYSKFTKKAK